MSTMQQQRRKASKQTGRPADTERRFFETMHQRFRVRAREGVNARDWSRVERSFLAYGYFLEQEPDALNIPLP